MLISENTPICLNCGRLATSGSILRLQPPDEDCLSILRSGVPPPEEEKPAIQERLKETELKLSTLDDEIARAKAVLYRLVVQKNNLEFYLKEQKSLLAPVRNLPDDVLEEIFILCSSGTGVDLLPQETDYPWSLSQVCHRWRAVALHLSQLWQKLVFDEQQFTNSGKRRIRFLSAALTRVDLCADRSRHQLLSVKIFESTMNKNASKNILVSLFGLSLRWERAVIGLTSTKSWDNNTSILRDCVGNLRYLTLDNFATAALSYDVFSNAPNLTHLGLIGDCKSFDRLKMPWSQLTHLVILMDVEAVAFLHFLRLMVNLEELSISSILEKGNQTPYPSLFRLPSLKLFSFSYTDYTAQYLLPFLQAPNLRELSLDLKDYIELAKLETVIERFIKQWNSSTLLIKMTLRGAIGPVAFEKLITAMPNIRYLDIKVHGYCQHDVFNILTKRRTQVLLPNLESLCIDNIFPRSIWELKSLVWSRVNPDADSISRSDKSVSRLRALRCHLVVDDDSRHFVEDLKILSDTLGLELDLEWTEP
ncbi:hypothetical protein BDQ12DRAFT_688941 [Crucibulum laeve]|uniref:F-box domain-containing protein n=1 Tax=Crucibulum laeve TaxID=68775 RepID=A0A5C3LPV4_9AGAR|nr:hypothetical protein BDQ12DRAFT_688941 [Crucibulum laeve]